MVTLVGYPPLSIRESGGMTNLSYFWFTQNYI